MWMLRSCQQRLHCARRARCGSKSSTRFCSGMPTFNSCPRMICRTAICLLPSSATRNTSFVTNWGISLKRRITIRPPPWFLVQKVDGIAWIASPIDEDVLLELFSQFMIDISTLVKLLPGSAAVTLPRVLDVDNLPIELPLDRVWSLTITVREDNALLSNFRFEHASLTPLLTT
ncbi:hypothetical protein AMAG_05883 [Allomyces macrogynus ATCC 38327]|uniref:Uncharacterized protein n=1 Tax=Allomyces macrogynus (strain ATCC 38327) TaxID=578462 RepID=A0A0L0SDN7_ALLM3|nr:hypothetical protein AMAG_05883 [Allomyces macrogynus ATCC 38327]|eukprot:KNE60500.1 hypothetical protein AMAG_05883 [Allomyces macrogynus ATCC 38327]